MAVLEKKFLDNLFSILSNSDSNKNEAFRYDPIVQIGFDFLGNDCLEYPRYLNKKDKIKMQYVYKKQGIVGVIKEFYSDGIVDKSMNEEVERKIVVLKNAFSSLPATTCKTVLEGFKIKLDEVNVLQVYASLGKTRKMKTLSDKYKFSDLNRFSIKLNEIIEQKIKKSESTINKRFEAMFYCFSAKEGKREKAYVNKMWLDFIFPPQSRFLYI